MFKLKKESKPQSPELRTGMGILVFESTTEVIQAESALKKAGFKVRVMGPPPQIQTGCDMVIEFSLLEQLVIIRVLRKNNLEPIQCIPVDAPLLEPVNIFHTKDFGDYLMVRAANMKMTIDKRTLEIVNVSGGGCPDVPYLARLMIGQNLKNAPEPAEHGTTLCGYTLQLAFEELKRKCL
jgi:hypothetical protein